MVAYKYSDDIYVQHNPVLYTTIFNGYKMSTNKNEKSFFFMYDLTL